MPALHSDRLSNWLSRLPDFRGKARLANALGRVAGRAEHGWGICSPAAGALLKVDLRDRIQRLMWAGCYEPQVRRCLQALLRPGEVFLDVGAHIGYHSLTAASLVGPGGKVFSFEADPFMFFRLTENIQPFPWITALHAAVWEKTESLVFERSSQSGESGWGTLTAVRDLGCGEHVSVDGLSLDEWWERDGHQPVRLIKLDAEGSEPAILQGAKNILRGPRPLLILELNEVVLRQAQSSPAELATELSAQRYELFGLQWPELERIELKNLPRSSEVLAIPAELLEDALRDLQHAGFKA